MTLEPNTPQQYIDDLIAEIHNKNVFSTPTISTELSLLSVNQSLMFCDKNKIEFLTECKILLEQYLL